MTSTLQLAGVASLAVSCLIAASSARAHDARAVARYVPDESSPGGMSLELDAEVDQWRFEVTGRPGHPRPGDDFELTVEALDDQRKPLTALLSLSGFYVTGGGGRAFGPVAARPSSGIYTFRTAFPSSGNYALLFEFADGTVRHSLRFEHAVGQPGSPRSLLGFTLFGIVMLIVLAKVARTRRQGSKPTLARGEA